MTGTDKTTEQKMRLPMNIQYFAEPNPQNPPAGNPQDPPADNNPSQDPPKDDPDPTTDALVQLAELRAANAKLKAEYDKLCTSEGNMRKQLRARQTQEEQEAEAKAEQEAKQKEYLSNLEKKLATIEATNRYLDMGFDKELAESTATAEITGEKEVVAANLKLFVTNSQKAMEAKIKADLMASMPTPQSGNDGNVDYSKQFEQALSSGDTQAAALAILQQAQANTPT